MDLGPTKNFKKRVYDSNLQEARKALEGVPTIQSMSPKQLQYVLKVSQHTEMNLYLSFYLKIYIAFEKNILTFYVCFFP